MSETLSHTSEPKKRFITSFHVGVFCLGLIVGAASVQAGRVYFASVTEKELSSVESNTGLPEDLDYTDVEEVYDSLKQNFDGQLSLDDVMDGLKRGLAESTGDPYTTYFSAEENEEFNGDVNGTFTGIGAELLKENGVITVSTPLSGFPAEKAGIRARDIILRINDEDATSLTLTEAVKKIRGEKGTTVTLDILRGEEQLEFSIVRDTITIPSVISSVEDGIGILEIVRFGDDTASLARKAANDFKAQNVRGVIVDVRNNPGGYLGEAVEIASLWLEKGKTVVEERRGDVTERVDRAVGGNVLSGVKTVVLINGGSASASEILAGALKDSGAATLVGETTFGKGSVQQIDQFLAGDALKVTIAKWYTPSGQNIDKQGIKPDTEVSISAEDQAANKDPQKDNALTIIRQ